MEGCGVHGAFSKSTRDMSIDGLAFEEEVDEKERTLNDGHRNFLMSSLLLSAASYIKLASSEDSCGTVFVSPLTSSIGRKKKSSVKAVQSTNDFGHYDNAAAQEHSNRLSESLKPIPTESLSRPNKEENPKTQSYNETVSSTHKERGNQLEPKCSKEVQTYEWLYPTAKTHESTPCYLAGPSKSKSLVLAVVIVLLFGIVACINTPANERMHEEWRRLETFSLYRGNGNGINLAKNGFYSNGTPTRTFCFDCNLMVSDWQYYDDTEHVHRIRSPNCPMHDHSFSQNIPIERTANHIDHAGSAHSHGSVARSNRIQRSNVQDEQRSGHDAVGALHGVLRANHGASTDMHGTERAEPTRQGADRASHGAEPARQGADRASHGAKPTRQGADRASHGAEPKRKGADRASHGAEPTMLDADRASRGAEPTMLDADRASYGAEPTRQDADRASRGAEPTRQDADRASHGAEPTILDADRASHGAEPTRQDADRASHGAEPTRQDADRASHGAEPTRQDADRASHGAEPTMLDADRASHGAEPKRQGADRASHGAEPTRQDADRASHGAEPSRQGADRASHGAEPTRQGADRASHGAEPTRQDADRASHGAEPTILDADRAAHGAEPTILDADRASHGAEPTRQDADRASHGAEPTRQDADRASHGAEPTRQDADRASHGAEPTRQDADRASHGAEPTRQDADRASHGAEPTRQDADRASHGAEPTRQDADRASHGAEPTMLDADRAAHGSERSHYGDRAAHGADRTEIGLDTASQRTGGHGGRSGRNVNQPSLAWLLQYLQQRRTVPQYDEVNYEQLFLPQPNLPSHPVHRTPYYTAHPPTSPGVDPSGQAHTPTSPGIDLSRQAHTPTSPGVDPRGQAHTPTSPGVDPSGQAHIPTSPGVEPSRQAHIPPSPGVDPSRQAHTPTSPGIDSSRQAHTPTSPGVDPSGQAHTPTSPGIDPSRQAHIPTVQGIEIVEHSAEGDTALQRAEGGGDISARAGSSTIFASLVQYLRGRHSLQLDDENNAQLLLPEPDLYDRPLSYTELGVTLRTEVDDSSRSRCRCTILNAQDQQHNEGAFSSSQAADLQDGSDDPQVEHNMVSCLICVVGLIVSLLPRED